VPTSALRVWIDAQLPPALARWLRTEYGVDAAHVEEVGLLRATDAEIFRAAREAKVIVAAKDADFVAAARAARPAPTASVGDVRERLERAPPHALSSAVAAGRGALSSGRAAG
jgi:uncharacterized protein with PIN domain